MTNRVRLAEAMKMLEMASESLKSHIHERILA
jgi:hypothetical protein